MLGEHSFQILLWLSASAFAVSLLGAAEYIPFLKEYPGTVFWIFLVLAVALFLLGIGPAFRGETRTLRPGMISLVGMVICGLGFIAFAIAYFEPSGSWTDSPSASQADFPSRSQLDSPSAVAKLAELGWTAKPALDSIQFEVANRALPPMKESAVYFAQLSKPFQLHFQQVPGLGHKLIKRIPFLGEG